MRCSPAPSQSVPFTERYFLVADSLDLVAMVVIGGIGSTFGAVLGALWVVGLPALFPDNNLVPLFTSSLGLLVLLLYFPGGFVQIAYAARDALLDWLDASAAGRRRRAERRSRRRAVARRPRSPLGPPRPTPRSRVDDVSRAIRWHPAVDDVSIAASAPARSSGSSAPTAPASRRS